MDKKEDLDFVDKVARPLMIALWIIVAAAILATLFKPDVFGQGAGVGGAQNPVVVNAGAVGEGVCTGAVWNQADLGPAPWNTGRYSLIVGVTPQPFTCTVPVVNGFYTVDLQLIEPNKTAAGQRVFNVTANGGQVTHNIDVFKEAGGGKRPYDVRMFVAVSNGVLKLDFKPVAGNAYVAGVVVSPFLGAGSSAPGGLDLSGMVGGSVPVGGGKWVDVFDQSRGEWIGAILNGVPVGGRETPLNSVTGGVPWRFAITDGQGRLAGAASSDASVVSVEAQRTVMGTWVPGTGVGAKVNVAVYRNGVRLSPGDYTVAWPNKLFPPEVTVPGSVAGDKMVVDYFVYGIVGAGQVH